VRLALCAIPNLYVVTDAIEAAGCPDGVYQLGGREVVKEAGAPACATARWPAAC
jgi:N-acetylglucosamine-6-phosphate deacetylase